MAVVNWSTAAIVPSNTGLVRNMTAYVAIAAGQAVYEDLTQGGKANLADADALVSSLVVGIAVNTAKAGEPVQVAISGNTITASTGTPLVVGRMYGLSVTAGALAPEADFGTDPTTGDFPCFIGFAISTTALYIAPIPCGVARS